MSKVGTCVNLNWIPLLSARSRFPPVCTTPVPVPANVIPPAEPAVSDGPLRLILRAAITLPVTPLGSEMAAEKLKISRPEFMVICFGSAGLYKSNDILLMSPVVVANETGLRVDESMPGAGIFTRLSTLKASLPSNDWGSDGSNFTVIVLVLVVTVGKSFAVNGIGGAWSG